jgi:hypothetical protein
MPSQNDLSLIAGIIDRLNDNRVKNFAYTSAAFDQDIIDSVANFNFSAEQNIPVDPDLNPVILDKGMRAQSASLSREGINHFFGRGSYNLNKLVQQFKAFIGMTAAVWSHNAFEYDPGAKYAFNDMCFLVETVNNVKVFTFYQRTSHSPPYIQNVPPTVSLHWAPMQNKTSTSALLPFKAPGYQHRYTVIDLTSGYVPATWYPVITTPQDFEAKVAGTKEGALQVLIEAYCNGTVGGYTGNHRAELSVLSKFTGFQDSSTDIVFNNAFINQEDGQVIAVEKSPIGFSKLPRGRQAVVWLKGGSKYALYNSFGSMFTLVTGVYDNLLDSTISPVNEKPFTVNSGRIGARIQTPDAEEKSDAVNLGQVAGSLSLPKRLASGEQLDSIRTPGLYVAETPVIGNTIGNVPVAAPGIFELVVEGDKAGQIMTVQRFTHRASGDVWVRVMAGVIGIVPWYLASSPEGVYVMMQGLYAFQIDTAGHLILHYQSGTDVPAFHIDANGHLIADIA